MQDGAGRTAVQVAAAAGHVEVVALVLDSGRLQAGKGLTALHLAVQQGRDDLIGDLLKLPGVAPDTRDSDGLSALHWAASKGASSPRPPFVPPSCLLQSWYVAGCTCMEAMR